MATVTVPAEFFRGELRVYGNWREALIRELLQNALDANPTRITAQLSTQDGHGRLVFVDDGHGMSREVLEQVFFALGKTTKTGEGQVGGFGRARIITCFAQTSYQIRTGNLMVSGRGGEYTITETAERIPGCAFSIDLLDSDHHDVLDAFERVLRTCTLPVPVTINDTPYSTKRLPDRATRVLRDHDDRAWAKVYVTRGSGRILVRVRGLNMFTRWYGGSEDIVVELAPNRSREVLSASRDTLHTTFADELDRFITALTQNRRKALRTPSAPLDVHIGGGGFIATDAETDADAGDADGTDGSDLGALPVPAGPGTADGTGRTVRVVPGNQAAFENLDRSRAVDPALFEDVRDEVPLGFDVFMMADNTDARVRKLARSWNPTSWGASTGRRRRQLLFAWKAACGVVVDELVVLYPSLGRVLWTVGWTFDAEVEAVHRDAGGGHVFALNPVTEAGTSKYQVSSRAARHKLLAIAAHEVAHVIAGDHDESFASVLTSLYGALDPIAADRAMREALAGN